MNRVTVPCFVSLYLVPCHCTVSLHREPSHCTVYHVPCEAVTVSYTCTVCPSILYGCVFALLYRACLQWGVLDDTSGSNLVTGRLAALLALVASACVGSYAVLARLCGSKRDCNQVHPYVVWLPVGGVAFCGCW